MIFYCPKRGRPILVTADPRDFDRQDDAHDGALWRQLWRMIRGRAG